MTVNNFDSVFQFHGHMCSARALLVKNPEQIVKAIQCHVRLDTGRVSYMLMFPGRVIGNVNGFASGSMVR